MTSCMCCPVIYWMIYPEQCQKGKYVNKEMAEIDCMYIICVWCMEFCSCIKLRVIVGGFHGFKKDYWRLMSSYWAQPLTGH